MALHPKLLELERDSSVHGVHGSLPFFLSLRRTSEFSDIHSFGFHKVPHVGVYGNEYTLCSALVLLSLPAVPRCIQLLPSELLSALELHSKIHGNTFSQISDSFLSRECSQERVVAQRVVKLALEAACKRVGKLGGFGSGFKQDNITIGIENWNASDGMETTWNGISRDNDMGIWNGTLGGTTKREKVKVTHRDVMDVDSFPKQKQNVKFISNEIIIHVSEPAEMQVEDEEEELERRNVAKRLVFKCIRAACNILTAHEQKRDSIESLISSTKRMRISDQSPTPPNETVKINPPQSPLPEQRSVTPESLQLQKLRKKRGRSESHDVNSLMDYDQIRTKLHGLLRNEGKGLSASRETIGEEEEEEEEVEEEGTTSLVATLGALTLNEADLESCSEEEKDYKEEKKRGKNFTFSFQKSNTSSLFKFKSGGKFDTSVNTKSSNLQQPAIHAPSFLREPVIPTHVSSFSNSLPVHSDIRTAANAGSVPDMDFYITIHTCPPRGVCQKFLCNNTDEVNLLYHCWLFGDIPCDPSVTVSDRVEMGIFDPCYVQPVHLELNDGGIPFHFTDQRTVCIHSCCFSPENAQFQLQQIPDKEMLPFGTFHSFFSAARHRDRRVVVLHILPSSPSTEQAIREIVHSPTTLKQLLENLNHKFPEMTSKISNLILPL